MARRREDLTYVNIGGIWKVRGRDPDGIRTNSYTTHQTKISKAKTWAEKRYKEGKLFKFQVGNTMKEFIDEQNFFDYPNCLYIKTRIGRNGSYSRSNADLHRGNLKKYILPWFGDKPLNEITVKDIEDWLIFLHDQGLANTTINHKLETLRIILKEALRLGKTSNDCISRVEQYKRERKERKILTIEEVKSLFNIDTWESLWTSFIVFIANALAAFTGMRLGEVIGLQVENFHSGHVIVKHSYERKYGLKDTKTHDIRKIPVPKRVAEYITEIIEGRTTGYVFSNNGGITPLYHKTITRGLYKALERIGIKKGERVKRIINFHGHRHFFNTLLRNKIPDFLLTKLTGHKTKEMIEHYTHSTAEQFESIRISQDEIFGGIL